MNVLHVGDVRLLWGGVRWGPNASSPPPNPEEDMHSLLTMLSTLAQLKAVYW